MQLDGQHVVAGGHLEHGADHTVVAVLLVGAAGGGGGLDGARGHVVSVDLLAVHVGDDTVAVVEFRLVGGEVREASEVLAEVLGAGERGHRAEGSVGEGRFAEVHGRPVGGNGAGGRVDLPLFRLLHRVMHRQGKDFADRLGQIILEHDVAVQAGHAHERARVPGIAHSVDQRDRVLVVRTGGEAVLVRSALRSAEGGAPLQHRAPAANVVGLLGSPIYAALVNREVGFSLFASQCARHEGNYA